MGALVKGTYVFALPGSTSACRDAWDEILLFQLDSILNPRDQHSMHERVAELGAETGDERTIPFPCRDRIHP